MTPLVSVIIPCRNEELFLERCLQSIVAADYPPESLEIIVAEGRSSDGTRALLDALAARQPLLRVIDNPERITPVALNRAIAAARGDIIVRFDAHATMPGDYIRRSVDLLQCSGADNAGGAIRTLPQSAGPFSAAIVAVLSSRFGVGDSGFRTASSDGTPRLADTVFGGCWHRSLFDRIGGFNERLPRSQDIEFNLRIVRAGGTILLDPSLVSDYYARSTLRSFWTHNFHNGRWAVLPFAWSQIIPVRPRHLIPLAFVTSLLASMPLPFPWSIAILAAYALVNLACSAPLAVAQRRPSFLILLPIAFASLHVAYGLGSACGVLQLAFLKLRSHPPSPLLRQP